MGLHKEAKPEMLERSGPRGGVGLDYGAVMWNARCA